MYVKKYYADDLEFIAKMAKELLDELKEFKEESKKEDDSVKEETVPFDIALNHILSEWRKDNFHAKIKRVDMPEGEYVCVMLATQKEPFLAYQHANGWRPYSPNNNSIFSNKWLIIE